MSAIGEAVPSLLGGVDGPGSIEDFRGAAHRQGQQIPCGPEPILHLGRKEVKGVS